MIGAGSSSVTFPDIEESYTTLDDVVRSLSALEDFFRLHRDRRAVFITGYKLTTQEIRRWVRQNRFTDSQWVERYAVIFADLYRKALLEWERGVLDQVPRSWRIAFQACRSGQSLILQELILGMNAHVNHDLALALVEASMQPKRDDRKRDHERVNQILRQVADVIQAEIATLYAPGLKKIDLAGGRLDEVLTQFSLEKAREHAWLSASLLDAAKGGFRSSLKLWLDRQSGVQARLILSAPSAIPCLVDLLVRLEAPYPWWKNLSSQRLEKEAERQTVEASRLRE